MALSNSKGLDLNNLYELGMPIKLGLAILAVVAVLGVGYVGVFQGQLETLEGAKQQEETLKGTFKEKAVKAANLDNLKQELAALEEAFKQLLKQLPTQAEVDNLVSELHQAASANGMRISSLTPMSPVNDGPIQRLPYDLSISGQYGQISKFARDIGGLSRIITLSNLNISKDDKTGLITLRAIANTYKARPVEELAAEQKAASAANNQNGTTK
ncbi:MAG: type 4a pilus biogenesis protein PilO [Neisseria sp.]|nr:type 4a pilus biogenesis protein PilO [Neisseria sp.]